MEKTIRLELLKPLNVTWKEAGQALRDVQYAIPGIAAVIEESLKYTGGDGEANFQLSLTN